jgi:hypothetical protein
MAHANSDHRGHLVGFLVKDLSGGIDVALGTDGWRRLDGRFNQSNTMVTVSHIIQRSMNHKDIIGYRVWLNYGPGYPTSNTSHDYERIL